MRSSLPKFPTVQKPVLIPVRQRGGFSIPEARQDAIQLTHSLAHGDRHLYACHCIRLNAFGVWVAEEDEDGVADVLVDRPTKLEGDLRHLSQIMVEELRQILGFQPFSRLGEAFEVREKDR